MATKKEPSNGSVHEMSMIVGELKGELKSIVKEVKGAIEHVNSNLKMATAAVSSRIDQVATDLQEHRDTVAESSREAVRDRGALRDRFEDLRVEVVDLKSTGLSTQQEVAELRNDMSNANEKLGNMPVIMAAVGKVSDLDKSLVVLGKKESRIRGWIDAGKIGWKVILAVLSGLAIVGYTIFQQIILPRWQ